MGENLRVTYEKCEKVVKKLRGEVEGLLRDVVSVRKEKEDKMKEMEEDIKSTALSVDEMMVRFFGRTSLKQYLPCKPDRYGIKLWGLCAANGYLFNLDVYCGKNDPSIGINLLACALGSRVVLQMINPLLNGLSRKKLSDYHLYCDHFFTSPDLLIHLHKCGLRSTGTVRKDRVKEKHEFAKNDPRGSYKVTCGITPITPVKRFSRAAQERVQLGFPRAFSLYNNYMGRVDLHDFRCKKTLELRYYSTDNPVNQKQQEELINTGSNKFHTT
ncbi:piggyBac transposable element-derived protein 3-like [Belonocnema kinseyi]|uniref:piggyBac transposable element-derived protein 3-like n=1 Tax=Belonocnema kinseyi TaxID=2817044 RepID=UPI00143D0ACD|nr:piggyBac transposable element-derived protein 3-like [Belonocnema kinseyi]